MSRDDERIHRLLEALLDQPPVERPRWLAQALPDEPDLQARLIAAVSDGDEGEGSAHVAFALESSGPNQAVLPTKIGRYEIRERLGYGGMGILYKAVDPALNRQVAIKLLRFNVDELHERFTREAHAIARLSHRNIVTIFDVGTHEGYPFIAMEYIAGDTLETLIRRRPVLPLPQQVRLMVDLCEGLAYAHKGGVIHRDIKPSNMMVADDRTLKIIDFGIARLLDSSITRTGNVMGTLHYMAPEQLEGGATDRLSDMFSAGLVIYELLCGQRAFPGDAQLVVARNILSAEPRSLTELVPGIDAELVHIVMRALRKRPQDRYPDLNAMSTDLMRVVTRLESASSPPAVGDRARIDSVSQPRRPGVWRPTSNMVGAGGVVVAAFAAVTLAWWLAGEPTVVPSSPAGQSQPAAEPRTHAVDSTNGIAGERGAQAPPQRPTADAATTARSTASQTAAKSAPASNSAPESSDQGTRSTAAARITAMLSEAESLRRRREYDAAIAQYLQVLALAPHDEKIRAGIRETNEAKQRAEEALEKLSGPSARPSANTSSAEADAQRFVGVALKAMDAGDDGAAQRALEDALRVDPKNDSAQKLLKILTGR